MLSAGLGRAGSGGSDEGRASVHSHPRPRVRAMSLSQDAVLAFLLERGGRARNSDLVARFKESINCRDPDEKKRNRELFKAHVNSVAVVQKADDDVKFVVVKKKFQDGKMFTADDNNNNNNSSSFSSRRRRRRRRSGSCSENVGTHQSLADVHAARPSVWRSVTPGEAAAVFALVAVKSREDPSRRHLQAARSSGAGEPPPGRGEEHEWLVKCAAGRWGQALGLLRRHAQLAGRRDFISGYTALHWAAKSGDGAVMREILQSGAGVDVNAQTHAGYTPLHLAAIHGHEAVIALLVRGCGADCDVRDNGGKKARHYLHAGARPEVRRMLGDPAARAHLGGDGGRPADLQRGFNTLSRLFHPHTGHRKKPRPRPTASATPGSSAD
ncbi:ankyrin repeat domain-containing protein SOWAHA [Denticeps clupeoides]|uniref:ankyrin repeat domain-containing protein SOWAHA n=1 Tax=Denticeps clupeoides TaxID=299321 RepID=UPI0010A4E024|nr:ankyrin repeat domain-containing protein SOWAHA [Denticeps clupeoides]